MAHRFNVNPVEAVNTAEPFAIANDPAQGAFRW